MHNLRGLAGGEHEIMQTRCRMPRLKYSKCSVNVPYEKVGSADGSVVYFPYHAFDEKFRYHVSSVLYIVNVYFT